MVTMVHASKIRSVALLGRLLLRLDILTPRTL